MLLAATAAASALLFGSLWAQEATNAPASIVPILRVIVTSQAYDPFQPWQKLAPGVRAGYAFLNGDGLLVTTEDLVRNSTMVELQRPAGGEKYEASVALADENVNLAIIKPHDGDAIIGLSGIACANAAGIDTRLKIVQFDDTGRIREGDAQIVEVSFCDLPSAKGASLAFKALTDINVNGTGAGAILDNKLVGLVMAYDRTTRIATIVPYPIISRFLECAGNEQYGGFATAGFSWTQLLDPAERRYLGVPDDGQGVVVSSILPNMGAATSLKSGDVILKWDGYDVDNMGYYKDPDFGRMLFPHMIKGRRKPGDSAPVKIIRDKNPMNVSVPLAAFQDEDALIPENVAGKQVSYLVEGGLILRELTGDYLRAHGAGWATSCDSRLVNMYVMRALRPERKGDRIVILSRVLPDAINVGYEFLNDEIVDEINGQPVRNMSDVFAVVDKDTRIKTLKIKGIPLPIALDPAELKDANERIAAGYGIPALRYDVLRNKPHSSDGQ